MCKVVAAAIGRHNHKQPAEPAAGTCCRTVDIKAAKNKHDA